MSVLIDVNNILHVVGVLPPDLAGIDIEELGDLIQRSRFRRDHVVFVCDGKRRRHATTPDIKVVFSGAGVSADDVIIGMVDRSTAPRRLTVVSNDREITTAARRRRAKVISAESFLSTLAEDSRADSVASIRARRAAESAPANDRQVGEWMKAFGLESDPVAKIASSPATRGPSGRQGGGSPSGSVPRRTRTRIHDANRLADIDPEDLDEIDMRRLLDGDR